MPQLPPPSLLLIVQLHHLQALLHLGVVPNPATGQPNPVSLDKVNHELALLKVLREKTEGNLTPEEEEILDQAIDGIHGALESLG